MWREKRNDILGEKRREKYTLSTDFGILRVVVVVKKWHPHPKSLTKPVDSIFCRRLIFFLFFRSHSHQKNDIILVSSFFLFFKPKTHTHKTDRQTTSSLKKKEKTCASSSFLLPLSFHTTKRRRRRIMGNQRARSRGLRHGTRNMFTRGFRQNGPKNATTYLRTFRVSDAESENCARGFFFRFSWKRFSVQIRTGRKPSVWRQTRQRLPRLESHARSSRVE